LPSWYVNDELIFSRPLSVEQASSEVTAAYKAGIIWGRVLDGSGGMGVDALAMAAVATELTYLERDALLSEIFAWNVSVLTKNNIEILTGDTESFLRNSNKKYDWIFLDPARRNMDKKRVVDMQDGSPDILALMPLLFKHTHHILLKAAPMLDLHLAIKQLRYVRKIYIIQWKQEVRELLFHIQPGEEKTPLTIHCAEAGGKEVLWPYMQDYEGGYGPLSAYLYLPAPALLKSGNFNGIAHHYGLKKLAAMTHLYTADFYNQNFLGHCVKITEAANFREVKNLIKKHHISKVNIVIKNIPITNDQIVKKYKISEGGKAFLIIYKDREDKAKVVYGFPAE